MSHHSMHVVASQQDQLKASSAREVLSSSLNAHEMDLHVNKTFLITVLLPLAEDNSLHQQ